MSVNVLERHTAVVLMVLLAGCMAEGRAEIAPIDSEDVGQASEAFKDDEDKPVECKVDGADGTIQGGQTAYCAMVFDGKGLGNVAGPFNDANVCVKRDGLDGAPTWDVMCSFDCLYTSEPTEQNADGDYTWEPYCEVDPEDENYEVYRGGCDELKPTETTARIESTVVGFSDGQACEDQVAMAGGAAAFCQMRTSQDFQDGVCHNASVFAAADTGRVTDINGSRGYLRINEGWCCLVTGFVRR